MPGGGCALPAYNPKSPLAQGLLKLPVLAASTSLRRSRKAGQPAWMRAEGRVLQGRCLARPEACRDKSKDRAAAMLLAGAGGTGAAATGRPLCAPSAMMT